MLTNDVKSRGFSDLTQNWIRWSHSHCTLSLKISCKSVQPFSRNLANKETEKERKIQRNRSKTIPRPPIYRGRGKNCNIRYILLCLTHACIISYHLSWSKFIKAASAACWSINWALTGERASEIWRRRSRLDFSGCGMGWQGWRRAWSSCPSDGNLPLLAGCPALCSTSCTSHPAA